MRKIVVILFFLIFLVGFGQFSAKQASAQYGCLAGQSNPHNACSGVTCTSTAGCGTSSCVNNTSCGGCLAGQSNPHSICSGTTCTSTAGCGPSNCVNNTSCGGCLIPGQSNPHTTCSGTTCTSTAGCGANACVDNTTCGGCLIPGQTNPHTACSGATCTSYASCGVSSCSGFSCCPASGTIIGGTYCCGSDVCVEVANGDCTTSPNVNTTCNPVAGCRGGACIPTYTISGTVFVDTSGDGIWDAPGEVGYSGPPVATVTVKIAGTNSVVGNGSTNGSGVYTIANFVAGDYDVVYDTGSTPRYRLTTANIQTVHLPGPGTADFGIELIPPPVCSLGIGYSQSPPINPRGFTDISVSGCPNPPPTSTFTWTDDPACIGSSGTPSTFGGQSDNPPGAATSSTNRWNAPSCSTNVGLTCHPKVDVTNIGGTTPYQATIQIPATYTVTANVQEVTGTSSDCPPAVNNPYTTLAVGFDLSGNSKSTSTGTYVYECVLGGNYTLGIVAPDGYTVVKNSTGGSGSSVTFSPLNTDKTVTFCIAPTNPWLQTDMGDVRFYRNLSNLVPIDKYASIGENILPQNSQYPGIFYSSGGTLKFGNGKSSGKQWEINSEYIINAKTQNRNGGVSYDFYKSKARKEGVTIVPISDGSLDSSKLTANGVYEVASGGTGNLSIDVPLAISGKRIVILVSGDAVINNNITVTNGLFIIAAKGSIIVAYEVDATHPLNNLDGYYSAEKDIILSSRGSTCLGGVADDQLTVNGALIAYGLKPFASVGPSGGTIQNKRSLCLTNLTTPSLKVLSRPDFLIQMTDFYKTSYTKWQEINP